MWKLIVPTKHYLLGVDGAAPNVRNGQKEVLRTRQACQTSPKAGPGEEPSRSMMSFAKRKTLLPRVKNQPFKIVP